MDHVSKLYKLYNKPVDFVKEFLHPLRKKYHKDFFALKDVSFEIEKGTTVGIIGRNGAGKSTLLKILSGVLSQNSGSVYVNGRISSLLELGAGFCPDLSGMDNIYFNGAVMGFSKKEIDGKLKEILEFADIGDYIYQPVKNYSSGMFVRLAFAVAVSVDPDILIIDEALAVGDIAFQQKCYQKFEDFKKKGKTILFVTHSMDSVIRYCDLVFVFERGVLVHSGVPKNSVDYYKKIIVSDSHGSGALSDNSSVLEYGDDSAEIIEYGLIGRDNKKRNIFLSGENVVVRMSILFKNKVENPIFAFTIRDIKGLELTGTNTLIEEVLSGNYEAGDRVNVEFSLSLNLQAGNYSLCLGCTNYDFRDNFLVYHRLYDAVLFEIVAGKRFIGIVDPKSEIKIVKQ